MRKIVLARVFQRGRSLWELWIRLPVRRDIELGRVAGCESARVADNAHAETRLDVLSARAQT